MSEQNGNSLTLANTFNAPHLTFNRMVLGSIPSRPTIPPPDLCG